MSIIIRAFKFEARPAAPWNWDDMRPVLKEMAEASLRAHHRAVRFLIANDPLDWESVEDKKGNTKQKLTKMPQLSTGLYQDLAHQSDIQPILMSGCIPQICRNVERRWRALRWEMAIGKINRHLNYRPPCPVFIKSQDWRIIQDDGGHYLVEVQNTSRQGKLLFQLDTRRVGKHTRLMLQKLMAWPAVQKEISKLTKGKGKGKESKDLSEQARGQHLKEGGYAQNDCKIFFDGKNITLAIAYQYYVPGKSPQLGRKLVVRENAAGGWDIACEAVGFDVDDKLIPRINLGKQKQALARLRRRQVYAEQQQQQDLRFNRNHDGDKKRKDRLAESERIATKRANLCETTNHKASAEIVRFAFAHEVGEIELRLPENSQEARERKDTWPWYQLATQIKYKATDIAVTELECVAGEWKEKQRKTKNKPKDPEELVAIEIVD